MPTTDRILEDALALTAQERAEVAHRLILSLEPDEAHDANADQAWAEEIRRRRAAIRNGEMELRDWKDALLEIEKALVRNDGA